ncbi:MAG: glycosyltransferase family 4 protein [Bacteroidota bacterium]
MRIAVITVAPTPYRDPVFARLSDFQQDEVHVLYSTYREPNRDWSLSRFPENHIFLKERYLKKGDGINYIHFNPDVWSHLKKIDPDVIITQGFNPTYLMGWLFSVIHGKKHIILFDDWLYLQNKLSKVHLAVRRLVFKKTQAFVGPGKHTADLYRSYGLSEDSLFDSQLCADDTIYTHNLPLEDRPYDLMFIGRFHELKLPFFFTEVASRLAEKRPRLRVLVIGSGPLKEAFLSSLEEAGLNYEYPGFVQPDQLPSYYAKSKIMLFTTAHDAWGLVANEALISGTPVISTPYAGCKDDLVVHGQNGFILDTEVDQWVDHCEKLLKNEGLWKKFSQNGVATKEYFNYEQAAKGLYAACKHAYAS